MRLRSLEIQGFKSFPDRTKLTFNDGITAVVGPNGSGKSNIADAVRWVLGEQSTKTLRGGRMEDVIFGGTQTRKPQGFSQVQIAIDNQDRALPCDKDEVLITRKLYRSGESEYRINGVGVRLRDVYELFMDTGLGRDGYSIIGQGKIAEIVSAKSVQRREIFEEAAGISKYRYRKMEAQRRLEGAQENLLRLKDILLELEQRVEPLRIQSEKAQQFLQLAKEKQTLEISLWVQTLERSRGRLREQEDKILLCKGEHDDIQQELDGIEAQLTQLFAEMQQLAVQIDERRGQVRQTEANSAQRSADLAVMHNDIAHNDASAARIRQELAQSNDSDQALDAKIATYEQAIAEKGCALQQMQQQQQTTQAALQALEAERETIRGRIETAKEQRYGLTQSINQARLSSASSGSLIDEAIKQLQMLEQSAATKDEAVIHIQQELADCTELAGVLEGTIQSLQNARQGCRMKLAGRQERLDALAEQRRTLEESLRAAQQRAKLLFDMENSLEGFQNSVKYVMGQVQKGALSGVYGPVSRLISVEQEHALAVEIALGAAMQNLVVQDEAVAKRAIHMLRDSRAGRATFLPVSTIRGSRLTDSWLPQAEGFVGLAADLVQYDSKFAGIIQQLLGRIAVVQDLDCATLLARQGGYRFRVVTLDGQVVNTGGSMTGGYTAKSAGILSRSREIETLRAQAEQYSKKIEELEGQRKTAQQDLSAVQATLSGLEGELATAQEDKIRCMANQERLTAAYEQAVYNKEQSAREYSRLTTHLEELRAENLSNEELAESFNRQLAAVAAGLEELNSQRDLILERVQQHNQQLSEYSVQAAALTNEIAGVQQMIGQLQDQKAGQQAHVRSFEQQLAELTAQNESIRAQIAQAQVQQQQDAEQVERLRQEMEQLSAQKNQHEAQSTALRAGEKEITARRELAARELARLEEQKTTLQTEYDSIISRLWEEYEITRSQAQEQALPIADANAAQRRLTELKAGIKALGSVNVAAVEEYKEVYERYSFLKAQLEDVEQSRAELERLIDSLTQDMQVIFAENFRRIAAHFSQVFAELFDGGRGELTLTDPNHVLESGIEIFVQPPGKIIKNLAALSGGEQAFVAIAIYFAILKVRPSPFCLLDEIEAALDDINVVKYAQYLRTLCEKTQFILITHRRGTMEEADVLYGVTMQEEGVSKLLELNVSEVESRLGI